MILLCLFRYPVKAGVNEISKQLSSAVKTEDSSLNSHDQATWCWAGCLSRHSNTSELVATRLLINQLSSDQVLLHSYS